MAYDVYAWNQDQVSAARLSRCRTLYSGVRAKEVTSGSAKSKSTQQNRGSSSLPPPFSSPARRSVSPLPGLSMKAVIQRVKSASVVGAS